MGVHWLLYGLMHIQMSDCKYLYTTLGVYIKGNRDVRSNGKQQIFFTFLLSRRAEDARSLGMLLMVDYPSSQQQWSDDIIGFRLSEANLSCTIIQGALVGRENHDECPTQGNDLASSYTSTI